MTAEEREGRRKARERARRAPIGCSGCVVALPLMCSEEPFCSAPAGEGRGARICEGWTSTGSQPPGAWVTFAFSRPRSRGMEGPVRSMSRIPTDLPARERDSASCVVIEDLPTPPLPERTWEG